MEEEEYPPAVVADLGGMAIRSLEKWGLSEKTQIELLTLSENATFRLTDQESRIDVVLRFQRSDHKTLPEIHSELTWIEALRKDNVIHTAQPFPGIDGGYVHSIVSPAGSNARKAVAFEFLDGKESSDHPDKNDLFHSLGILSARMHRHARNWKKPEGFERKTWNFDTIVGPLSPLGQWQNAKGLDQNDCRLIHRALEKARRKLEKYGHGPDRFGLIHADLRLANVLKDGETLKIIDFDDSGFSWFMWDFAASMSFIEHCPEAPGLLHAWVRGYISVAPLSREDIEIMPTLVFLRRVALTSWIASHSESNEAREIGDSYNLGTVKIAQSYLENSFLSELPLGMEYT